MCDRFGTVLEKLEQGVERATKQSSNELRQKTFEELRKDASKKAGKKTIFYSSFPFIGRGNVLYDRIVERDKIDADVDLILSE